VRTTLNLSPDLLNAAKRLAAARSMSVGDVISALALKGLEAQNQSALTRKSGFPVFVVSADAPTLGLQDIKRDEDGED
jgi:hypothetical protein